jgi:ribosome-binding protein aMBF1 (putative translation factor)
MIARREKYQSVAKKYHRVADLMERRGVDLERLVRDTGLDSQVIEAIARQRYTPSPEQRMRIARVLGMDCDQIIWGHATPVQEYIHGPI